MCKMTLNKCCSYECATISIHPDSGNRHLWEKLHIVIFWWQRLPIPHSYIVQYSTCCNNVRGCGQIGSQFLAEAWKSPFPNAKETFHSTSSYSMGRVVPYLSRGFWMEKWGEQILQLWVTSVTQKQARPFTPFKVHSQPAVVEDSGIMGTSRPSCHDV